MYDRKLFYCNFTFLSHLTHCLHQLPVRASYTGLPTEFLLQVQMQQAHINHYAGWYPTPNEHWWKKQRNKRRDMRKEKQNTEDKRRHARGTQRRKNIKRIKQENMREKQCRDLWEQSGLPKASYIGYWSCWIWGFQSQKQQMENFL